MPPHMLAKRQLCMYNAGMVKSITIRNVPEEVRNELAARAARAGRSLQEHLLAALIELAGRPDVATLVERIRARKKITGSALPADRILAHRDGDRR